MTQDSWYFECTEIGDGDPLTIDDLVNENQFFGNVAPDTDGVIYWTSTVIPEGFAAAPTGLLAPSNPGGDTVRIASGVGLVKGWLYVNDANVDFNVAGGAASAVDLIVLRRSNIDTVSTVRLALVRAGASSTAVVTQTADTWEIPIAYVTLTAGGAFSSLADAREFTRSTFRSFGNPLNRQGGSATVWSTTGTTGYVERRALMQGGAVRWTGGSAQTGTVVVTFPVAFSNIPVGFVIGRNGSGANIVFANVTTISASAMTITWLFATASTSLDFFWFAIGPE